MSQFVKVGLRDADVVQKCCSVIGLFDRDVAVIQMALRRGIPCATVIGGGYDDDIDVLGRRHSIIHRAAIKVNLEKQNQLDCIHWVQGVCRSYAAKSC